MNKIMLGAIIAAAFIAGTIATGTIAYAKPPSGQQDINQFEIIFDLIEGLQMQIDDLNDDGEPITINCPPGSVQTGIIMDGGGITELICETHIEGPVLGFYDVSQEYTATDEDEGNQTVAVQASCDEDDVAVSVTYGFNNDSTNVDETATFNVVGHVQFINILEGDILNVTTLCADFDPTHTNS